MNNFDNISFEELKNIVCDNVLLLKEIEEPAKKQELLKIIAEQSKTLNELLIFSLIKERDNFFGNIAIQLNRRINFKLKAPAAVSFKGVYFDLEINPLMLFGPLADKDGNVKTFTLEEIKAIYIHEMYHIICKHLPRTLPLFKRYPQIILNLGTDCSINQFIPGLPDGCVTLESLAKDWKVKRPLEKERECEYYIKGLLEEYKDNEEFKDKVDQQSQGKGQGQQGDGGGDGQSDDNYDGENGAYEDTPDYYDSHDAWQKSDNSQNMSNADDVLREMMNTAASKSRGRIPSNIQEVMKKLNEKPIINWREQLRRYIGQLSKPYKKTITRKSRRQPDRCDLRGRLNDHVSELIVAIDTSGSMDNETISYCMNEVFNIIKEQNAKITIIECDCKITRIYEAKTAKDVKPDVTGRGGTSFQPVFDWIKENNKRNVVVVYFTDGYGEYELRERPISYRNLWVLTGRSSELSLREPFGEVKELRLDEKWKNRR